MKHLILALLATALLAGTAHAAGQPTAEQKDDFFKTCMKIAEDQALCTCKADAAMTLLDGDFMAEVIAGMKGKAPPTADNVRYGRYIAQSNAKCIPGY